jgi:hypothetical protein
MNAELIWIFVSFFLTLLVFSYLFGDNVLFRLATYLFVGVTAGYFTTIIIYQVIWPRIVLPLVNGTTDERLLAAVPLLLGVLLLFKLFPRLSPIGSIPVGYLVGIGAALAIGGAVMGTVFGQVKGTIALFDFEAQAAQSTTPLVGVVEAVLILIGILTTLIFFHFSTRNQQQPVVQRAKWIEVLSKIGQVFIAITFGALFAGVYLAAIAALIDRLDFIKEVLFKIIAL